MSSATESTVSTLERIAELHGGAVPPRGDQPDHAAYVSKMLSDVVITDGASIPETCFSIEHTKAVRASICNLFHDQDVNIRRCLQAWFQKQCGAPPSQETFEIRLPMPANGDIPPKAMVLDFARRQFLVDVPTKQNLPILLANTYIN